MAATGITTEKMAKTPTLETQRLILRPISLADSEAIQKYFNDWEIIKNLSTVIPWPYPSNGAENYISEDALKRIRDISALIWVLVPKSGPDEAIGVIDFSPGGGAHGDRGFWIASKHQRQGLMSEAIARVNDFLFFTLKIEKFTVVNAKNNVGSRRVKEKTGAKFLKYGTLNHHSGETKTETWEVTRENWVRFKTTPKTENNESKLGVV